MRWMFDQEGLADSPMLIEPRSSIKRGRPLLIELFDQHVLFDQHMLIEPGGSINMGLPSLIELRGSMLDHHAGPQNL